MICPTVVPYFSAKSFVHPRLERVRLHNALDGRALRNLHELARRQDLVGGYIPATMRGPFGRKRIGRDVKPQCDLLVRVAMDGIVQARTTVDASTRPAHIFDQARFVVGGAGFGGDQE